jgi:uncharacterized tellurite resistance protein B-like protein
MAIFDRFPLKPVAEKIPKIFGPHVLSRRVSSALERATWSEFSPKPGNFFYREYFFFYIENESNSEMLNPVKLEHFRNLVSLSAVDGKIEDVERVALSKIAYDQGIPLDRLNVMLQRAQEYIYLIPQNQQERETQLNEMLELALIDGEFAKAEWELISMVGEKLGFTKDELDSIIQTHLRERESD